MLESETLGRGLLYAGVVFVKYYLPITLAYRRVVKYVYKIDLNSKNKEHF